MDALPLLNDPASPVDTNGVLQVKWPGQDKPVFHPVSIAWYTLSMLEASQVNSANSQAYRERALVNANYLLSGGIRNADGEIWFPYYFTYEIHQDPDMTIKGPWYSGMAQGLALSITSRLYKYTGDVKWKNEAIAIAKTFRIGKTKDKPWFANIDSQGYLWYELYPAYERPLHVVNGHLYTAWGLMDYLTLVNPQDTALAQQFDAAITTTRESFDAYRVPGQASLYCTDWYCRKEKWQPGNYHRGVAYQLNMTSLMTGDKVFADQSKTLLADHFW